MENSLNLSSPEPTVPSVRTIFKKPTNFYEVFEVSLDESVTATQNLKSSEEESISTVPGNVLPFRKTRQSFQQPFNVNSDDTAVTSESEQSVTFTKPQTVFTKKNKSIQNFFNVSYNETVDSSQPDSFSKTIDESNIVNKKQNPFRKTNEPENISVGECSIENSVNKSDESQKRFISSIEEDEADSTTFITKQNPFKKFAKQENNSVSQLKISREDENISVGDKTIEPEIHSTTNNSKEDEEADSSLMKSKLNSFKQTSEQVSRISITEQRTNNSIHDSALFPDPRQSNKNISLEKHIPKPNNTASFLEQSSINDDNLNNWMSDQSEEEIPIPRVPSINDNTSHTREKQSPAELPDSPEREENSVSEWEKKFNEIVANAKTKTEKIGMKINTQKTPEKRKPFKKSNMNIKKGDENKYKPPKLLKPAPFATKKLYEHIMKKLEPKYGIDTVLESENLVLCICDTVKMVTRRKNHQKKLIEDLKKELAKAGLIETTMDFYEFVIKFLPYSFRVKVVPCLQPVTNVVYPPKDVLSPFEKIL